MDFTFSVPPWAKNFFPFRPYLNHKRNLSHVIRKFPIIPLASSPKPCESLFLLQ